MTKCTQLILIKSVDNTDLIEAVFRFHQKDEKILLLANRNSSFLSGSFEQLHTKMKNFEYIYSHTNCMFLKEDTAVQKPTIGDNSFLDEIETFIRDSEYSFIYIHRLDTLLESLLPYECEYLISEISALAYKYSKKMIFSINDKTIQGRILNPLLSKVITQEYMISDQSGDEYKQVILLKSVNNTHLVKSALNLHQSDDEILFLSNTKQSSFSEIFKDLSENTRDFDELYPRISCMFLKKSWNSLDKLYGVNVFLIEIQEMMQSNKYASIYFHRLDTLFRGASQQDCEQMILKIKELSNYYHKKVIFSIDSKALFGRFLELILVEIVDFEQTDEMIIYKPANIITHKKVSKRFQV
jgi:hypothetical protein